MNKRVIIIALCRFGRKSQIYHCKKIIRLRTIRCWQDGWRIIWRSVELEHTSVFPEESNTCIHKNVNIPAKNKYEHVNHKSYGKCARKLRPRGEIIVELEWTTGSQLCSATFQISIKHHQKNSVIKLSMSHFFLSDWRALQHQQRWTVTTFNVTIREVLKVLMVTCVGRPDGWI